MGLSVEVDPAVTSLLTALGLLDADGQLVGEWFSHPLESVSTCLSNPTQRAALLRLLDEALPPQEHPLAPPGAVWHPLLEANDIGNVHLSVDGDILGLVLTAGTPPDVSPAVQVIASLPLVDAGGQEVRAVAASPEHPLDVGVVASLPSVGPNLVGVRVAVDIAGNVRARVRLEDAGEAVEIDPTRLDTEVLDAVALLIRSVLAQVGEAVGLDPDVAKGLQRLAAHLFGVMGVGDNSLPELPLAQAVSNPASLRAWLAGIVADPAQLTAWFTHVAGLVGAAPLDDVDPVVTGSGDAVRPLRATVVQLGDDVTVDLLASADASGALVLGVGVNAAAGTATRGASLSAMIDLISVGLAGSTTRATPLPAASVLLTVPVSALTGQDMGRIVAGAQWDGLNVAPTLRLDDVLVGGQRYTLDLSSAEAVAATGTTLVGQAISEAIGDDGVALHALALLGLVVPEDDTGTPVPGWPVLDLVSLVSGGDVLRAVAQFHREILEDPTLSWGTLLRELSGLLGLDATLDGSGTRSDPWALVLVADDDEALDVSIVAWDEAASGPDRQLRLGVRGKASSGIWRAGWTTELAAFDLPENAPGAGRFLGSQRLGVTLTEPPLLGDTAEGEPWVAVEAVDVAVSWVPGSLPDLRAEFTGLVVGIGAEATPPTPLVLPPPSGRLDLDKPDLGLGVDPDVVPALVRLVLGAVLRAFDQPTGWLVLLPTSTADLVAALRDPVTSLRERALAAAVETSPSGEPLLAGALAWLVERVAGVASVQGSGTYDDPWVLPFDDRDPTRTTAVLVWLDPSPEPDPAAASLAALLTGRRRVWLDGGLDTLAELLAGGDGLVPYSCATGGPYPAGTPVPCGHHALTSHPSTVQQVRTQVSAWGGGSVVLLSAGTGPGPRGWDALVAAYDPGHDPDADSLAAAALAYPVALDDDGSGGLTALAGQVDVAVDRVRTLTGASKVTLVGHGIAGLAARISAERRPATVRGVITVGTVNAVPEEDAENVAAAVTDPHVADAVRVAATLLAQDDGMSQDGLVGEVAHLAAVLNGGPVLEGVLPAPGSATASGLGSPPDDLTSAVPGLAIGGRVEGDLPTLLAPLLPRAEEPAAQPARRAAQRVGLAVQVVAPMPQANPGEARADLVLRADLNGAQALTATTVLRQDFGGWPGGWLVGGDGTVAADRSRARCRWAEIGLRLDRTPAGASVSPVVVLHEAAAAGARTQRLDLAALVPILAARASAAGRVALPDELSGPAVGAVLDALTAAGLVAADPGGALSVEVEALSSLLTTPAAVLSPRAGAVTDALAAALGATRTPGTTDGWTFEVTPEVALDVTRAPWTLRLRTVEDTDALAVTADLSVTLPGWATTLDTALTLGSDTAGLRLQWHSGPAPDLLVSLPPWLPPISLLPGVTNPADASAAVLEALPRALLTGLLAPALGDVLAGRLAGVPLDTVFTDPLRWVEPVDGPAVGALLEAIGAALGRPAPTVPGSLSLPGGLVVTASGAAGEPVEIRLAGRVPIDTGFALSPDLGLRIAVSESGVAVAPQGGIELAVTLPGAWGEIAIDVGASPAGLTLGISPAVGAGTGLDSRIELLPTFSGLGALAAAAERLLPRVLQELVEELTPAGGVQPGSPLDAALAVAEALAVYGRDAEGFTRPERADRLAAMLDPTWWENLAQDPAAITTAIGQVLDTLPLPLGDVDSSDGTIVWNVPLPVEANAGVGGGDIALTVGWTAARLPVVTVEAHRVVLGPVRLDEARLGYDAGDLVSGLVLRLAAGGMLAPIQPALVVDLEVDLDGPAGARFAVAIVPFGAGTEGDLELRLAPTQEIVAAQGIDHAALMFVEEWGVPLALEVLVTAFGDLLDVPLWGPPYTTGPGPTARDLLEAAGLLEDTLPDPGEAVLRAFQRAASGVAIRALDDTADAGVLDLTLVSQNVTVDGVAGVRTGVRLRGWVKVQASEDLTVTVRFGDAAWLDEDEAGVTVWLVEPWPGGVLPIRPTAALDLIGIGADFGREGANLLQGTLVIGKLGGLLFLEVDLFDDNSNPEVVVEGWGAGIVVTDANVDISSQDADSFLRKVLPESLAAPFDLTVVYRDGQLTIEGGDPAMPGRFELALPLDIDLAIIRITELLLALQTSRDGTPPSLEAALSGTASVGPIAAFVKRVGIIAVFGGDRPGLRLRYPDAVGLSIDTSQITLAGFVLVDEARGRYVGAIGLKLLSSFELAAVCIITTKMPDGSPGFSLLFLIAMKLPTPISLSYGFFFAGAGGLLGINRAVDLDRLRSGLRSGTADSILFPDPAQIVPRADQIIKDLEESFPVDRGQFVVGPMVLITWMSPPLITIKIGLIIQIGTPIRIAILGVLRASLPDAKEAVLDLKVAFLGTIDIGAKLLTFDAAIYDSFIGRGDLKLTLEGDIAVRLSWSDQPDFVTSIGGFHPRYRPASHLRLPAMRRLRLSLLKDNPRLSLGCYFAITSNSVQFGARLDFYFGVAGFSVEGEFGFDVLFQFSPFLFDAAVYARLAVMAGGSPLLALDLDFSLVGPTPWIAKGYASFKVLFFTVKAQFEKRFGEEALDSAPTASLVPLVTAELERAANWQAVLPSWAAGSVSLLEIQTAEGRVVIDAGGALTLSQRVLPLGVRITRYGTAKPGDASGFDVPKLWLETTPETPGAQPAGAEPVTEAFSPAAFQEMSEDDKLKAPSFERRTSGVRVQAGAGLSATYAQVRPSRYDLIVCDSADPADEVRTPAKDVPATQQPSPEAFTKLAMGGAAGRSAPARDLRWADQGNKEMAASAPTDLFAVVRVADLTPLATGLPASDAERRLTELAATEPGGEAALRVLPTAQLAKAV